MCVVYTVCVDVRVAVRVVNVHMRQRGMRGLGLMVVQYEERAASGVAIAANEV